LIWLINFVIIKFIPMKNIKALLVLLFLPFLSIAAVHQDPNIEFKHQTLELINYVLVVVSLISIRQFFWPGEKNRTLYQIFNMIFTIVYYLVSITFIVTHKAYFVDFDGLSDMGCVNKFFFDFGISMVFQIIVLFSFLINILYLIRFGRRYYLDMV